MECRRIVVYEWLRLFATILVVLGHSSYLAIGTVIGGVNYNLPSNINLIYNSSLFNIWKGFQPWVYQFHMPLFFILSGAVLGIRTVPFTKIDEFIRLKLKRLMIPFLVAGVFFMIPVRALGNFYSNVPLIQAICYFLQGLESGHLWFLPALFWCMLVFSILYSGLNRLGIRSTYVLWAVALVIQLLYQYIPFSVLELKTGLSYFFWFTSGYVFEKERQKIKYIDFRLMLPIALLVFWIEYHYYYLGAYSNIVFGSLMIYILSVYCTKYLQWFTHTKLWRLNINNLFYIYLFHDPLEYIALRFFMNSTYLQSSAGCVMYMLSRTVGVWIISIIIAEIVKFIIKLIRNYFSNSGDKYMLPL